MELRGFDITFLSSCAEYLNLIDSGESADLFILDLVMLPGGRVSDIASNHGMETGIVLAVETRKVHADTPVLVMTNTANVVTRNTAKEKLGDLTAVRLVPKSRMTTTGIFADLVKAAIDGTDGPAVDIHHDRVTRADRRYDVFISYASEDRDAVAKPLADELSDRGWSVWFDEFELSVSDSLRETIDMGLSRSRFGVVIMSPEFFSKNWPKKELAGLFAREATGGKMILPIRHRVTQDDVLRACPILADKIALDAEALTIAEMVDRIERVVG